MKNVSLLLLLLTANLNFSTIGFAQTVSAPKEFRQKDGLFKINIPDGWRTKELPNYVYILPPPPAGNGVMIHFLKSTLNTEQFKANINATIERIRKYQVEPTGGSVIANKETTVDGAYAKEFFYTVKLKDELMYFFRLSFFNKGLSFTIDYGDFSKEHVEKMEGVAEGLKF